MIDDETSPIVEEYGYRCYFPRGEGGLLRSFDSFNELEEAEAWARAVISAPPRLAGFEDSFGALAHVEEIDRSRPPLICRDDEQGRIFA